MSPKLRHDRNNLFSSRRVIWVFLAYAIPFAVWCGLSYTNVVDSFFLPSPSAIAKAIWELFKEHNLLFDIWVSIRRVSLAFILSVATALPVGILISVSKPARVLLEPIMVFARYIPVPALVPLVVLWVGVDEFSKILLLFFGTFFQLVFLIVDDINGVPDALSEAAKTLGAGKRDIIFRVLFPAALPTIYDDARVTLGWCWTYLLIAELVAATSGIGHLIAEAQRFAQVDVVMSGVLIIGGIGIISDSIFHALGRQAFEKYHR